MGIKWDHLSDFRTPFSCCVGLKTASSRSDAFQRELYARYVPRTRLPDQHGHSRQSPREASQSPRRRLTPNTTQNGTSEPSLLSRDGRSRAFVQGKKKRPRAHMAEGRHCPCRRAFKPAEKRLCFPAYFVAACSILPRNLSTCFLLPLHHRAILRSSYKRP